MKREVETFSWFSLMDDKWKEENTYLGEYRETVINFHIYTMSWEGGTFSQPQLPTIKSINSLDISSPCILVVQCIDVKQLQHHSLLSYSASVFRDEAFRLEHWLYKYLVLFFCLFDLSLSLLQSITYIFILSYIFYYIFLISVFP